MLTVRSRPSRRGSMTLCRCRPRSRFISMLMWRHVGVSAAHGTPWSGPSSVGPGLPLVTVTVGPLPPTGPNVPLGASTCPASFQLQQVMVASVLSPHVWNPPAVTAVNVPLGASVCPQRLSPQQVMVASVLSPHVWRPPAVTAVNVPLGASVCP